MVPFQSGTTTQHGKRKLVTVAACLRGLVIDHNVRASNHNARKGAHRRHCGFRRRLRGGAYLWSEASNRHRMASKASHLSDLWRAALGCRGSGAQNEREGRGTVIAGCLVRGPWGHLDLIRVQRAVALGCRSLLVSLFELPGHLRIFCPHDHGAELPRLLLLTGERTVQRASSSEACHASRSDHCSHIGGLLSRSSSQIALISAWRRTNLETLGGTISVHAGSLSSLCVLLMGRVRLM